ncbi:two-component system, chemotaxis family, response regulator CheY [Acetanaerobacterium elongatum]|uniref:Stage 0 sporulation protein A homolog n=2 Tax=Acetanaerobacterium elongatum TaxID=258515 RepID=A0A1H0B4R5_9FIRM|nr:two-component system, chemotaxis family, response regulator CheY [Acetanaerobacterium elongatum]
MKALVCDDSILVRKKFKELLTKIGFGTLLEATDGEEAVRIYKAQQPDIVFMDIIMPKKTGLEALKEIRAANPNAKVVMASSVGTQSHLKEAVDFGVYDFLQKPIEDAQVLKIVSNLANGK